jgi:hypothetical protein
MAGRHREEEDMRSMAAGTVRHFGLVATVVIALGGAGAGWAQQAPACDRAKAAACTDQKVVECLNQHKGNQAAISQCQMQQNMACNTANGCPNSAR